MANENHADFTPTIPDSQVTPTRAPYVPVGSFKFWAQKVLPTVYDDSLSYYEVLTKLVWHINKMIEDMDNFNQTIDSTLQAYDSTQEYVNNVKNTMVATYNQLQDYVNHYFDNLDVQNEINAKLDTMAMSGELSELISPFVPSLVTQWLNENVEPVGSAVVVDASLTVSGAAADSAEVGKFKNFMLKTAYNYIEIDKAPISGKILSSNGTISDIADNKYFVTNNIRVKPDTLYAISLDILYSNTVLVCYDENSTYISNITYNSGTDMSSNKRTFEKHLFRTPLNCTYVRIGYYGNANSGHLYEVLQYEYSHKDFSFTSDRILNSDGTITNAGGDTKYCVSNVIDVESNTEYAIDIRMKFTNTVVAFYTSALSLISTIPSTAGTDIGNNTRLFNKYHIITPANCVFVRIAYYESGSIFNVDLNYVPEYIKNSIDDILLPNSYEKYLPVEHEYTINKIIIADGSLANAGNNAWRVTDEIDCNYGDKFSLTCTMYYNNTAIAYYDANSNFIERISVGSIGEAIGGNYYKVTDYVFTVPNNGAKKIRFGYYYGESSQVFNLYNIVWALKADSTNWSNLKWVCVGDSLTEINNRATKRYYDYVSEKTGINVVNMGVSGTGYARRKEYDQAFYQRIQNCPTDADVVTIFGSFNDLGSDLPLGEANDTGTNSIAGCINTTIDNLQAIIPLVNLGIVAPTPWDTTKPALTGSAHDYVNMIETICKLRSIPFLNLWYESNLRPWDSNFREIAYSRDGGSGTHPDENGHKLIAPRFQSFLDSLLIH